MKAFFQFIYLGAALLAWSGLRAQIPATPTPSPYGIMGGINLHNRGVYVNARYVYGEHKYRRLIELYAGSMKGQNHSRIRSAYMELPEGSRFVPDKLNRLTVLSLGGGLSRTIFPKTSLNKIETVVGATAGLSLGLMRPYYMHYLVPDPLDPVYYVVEERKASPGEFIYDEIVGESYPWKHLKPARVYPGIHLRSFAYFNLNRYTNLIRALELGIQAHIFFQTIPLMYQSPNQASFLTVSLGFWEGRNKHKK